MGGLGLPHWKEHLGRPRYVPRTLQGTPKDNQEPPEDFQDTAGSAQGLPKNTSQSPRPPKCCPSDAHDCLYSWKFTKD